MKYLGCAYYPEYWGLDRLETDGALMRDAGINAARIGEFAWWHMEPRDGKFDFGWLKKSVDTLAKYGVQTILCTPTAAAPAWLVKAHPETLVIGKNGQRAYHGVRQHTCYVSKVFRRYAERVVEAMAKAMAGNKAIAGWQIDNEIGCSMFGNCHCPACQKRFRDWLKQRYKTLEALNRAWGTSFWSMVYSEWDEICLGDGGLNLAGSQVLDSFRFFSEMKIEYMLRQAHILRRYFPKTIITTNNFAGVDMFKGFETLDRVGADLYSPGNHRALIQSMDVHRGIKPDVPFWLTETGVGGEGSSVVPHNRQFRPRFWSFYAHGAETMIVFRWRSCLSAQEQDLLGILEHNGTARHRYKAVQQTFLESRDLNAKVAGLPLPKGEIGIIRDFESEWALASSRLKGLISSHSAAGKWYEAFSARHLTVDFLSTARDFKPYRLIILPPLPHVPEALDKKIRAFVKGGGVAVAMGPLGMWNENANYLPKSWPEGLSDVFGVTLESAMRLNTKFANWEIASSTNVEAPVVGNIGGQSVSGKFQHWIADLELKGAETMLSFTEGTFAGQPAITTNRFGKGHAIYIASPWVNPELTGALLGEAMKQAGIKQEFEAPLDVDIVRRGKCLFLINHSGQAVEIKGNLTGRPLLGRYAEGRVFLEPYDVCIIGETA